MKTISSLYWIVVIIGLDWAFVPEASAVPTSNPIGLYDTPIACPKVTRNNSPSSFSTSFLSESDDKDFSHEIEKTNAILLNGRFMLSTSLAHPNTHVWQVLLLTSFARDHPRVDVDKITPYALYMYCIHELHHMRHQIPTIPECWGVVDAMESDADTISGVRLQIAYYFMHHGQGNPVPSHVEDLIAQTAWNVHQRTALLYFAAMKNDATYMSLLWSYFCQQETSSKSELSEHSQPLACVRSLFLLPTRSSVLRQHSVLLDSPLAHKQRKVFDIFNGLMLTSKGLKPFQLFKILEQGANVHRLRMDVRLSFVGEESAIETFVQRLLSYGLDVNFFTGESFVLRLSITITARSWLPALLQAGMNPDIQYGAERESILLMSLGSMMDHAAVMLLEYGANPNLPTCTTLFSHAQDIGLAPIMLARTSEIIRLLVDKGADVNATDSKGSSVLFYAKSAEMAKTLLSLGADLHYLSPDNRNAIMAVIDKYEVVEYFLSLKKIPVNHPGPEGYTALHSSLGLGYPKVAKLLLQNGADINQYGGHGDKITPLMVIRSPSYLDTKTLINAGVLPDLQSASGETALLIAAQEGSLLMVRALLEVGADPNLATFTGTTPLMRATLRCLAAHVKLLLKFNASVTMINAEGMNALSIAARCPETTKAPIMALLNEARIQHRFQRFAKQIPPADPEIDASIDIDLSELD